MKKAVKLLSVLSAFFLGINILFIPARAEKISTEYLSGDILEDVKSSPASAGVSNLDIKAKAVVLMEPKTNTVLYENNKDKKLAPASVTKIMSLLIIMEAIENERINLKTVVTASDHAASMGGSQIWLKPNEQMTVDELLRASVIASANDATVALAEAVCGSEEVFVENMNVRAAELGMKNTHFVNACGLDADGHYTSAYDVALMSSALIKHDLIKKYSTVWMDALRNGKSELVNTNKLVRYYDGATGLKTGTTSKAGCCVSATAKKNNMELVAVVMGGENSNERFSGAKKLLDFGFANWSFVNLKADMNGDNRIPVKKGMAKYATYEATGEANILLKKGKAGKIEQQIELDSDLKAPVLTGDVIGKVKFVSDKNTLAEVDITSASTVEAVNFMNCLFEIIKKLLCP